MDNCICHFCGYEIKDAKARKAIEEETAAREKAITDAISSGKAIDVTDEFDNTHELLYGGEDLTKFEVIGKKFVYLPAQGMVFFRLTVNMIGFFPKAEPIAFSIFNKYSPDARFEGMPALCRGGKFEATTYNDCIVLSTSEDVEYEGSIPGGTIITGWWFSNGNHDELQGGDL